MNRTRLGWLALSLALLRHPATAHAYHVSDMIIGSTAAGGGALAIRYDFAKIVRVSASFSAGGQTLYSGTDPGWDAVYPSEPPLYALAANVPVRVEVVAIDAGLSLKIGATTLTTAGNSALEGTSDGAGNGQHLHPEWRLLLPDGVTGSYHVTFRLTTTAPAYTASPSYIATVSNLPEPTTTTTTASTTTTTVVGTSTTAPGSTTTAPGSTTTTSGSTTSTTLAAGERLAGKRLALRGKPGDPRRNSLSLLVKDLRVTLGAGPGSADDPTLYGASLVVVSTAGALDATYPLPTLGWTRDKDGKGYKYKDRASVYGPVRSVVIRPGKNARAEGAVKVEAHGSALIQSLATNPTPVSLVLRTGAYEYCAEFGGTTAFKAGVQLKASDAPAPATCAR